MYRRWLKRDTNKNYFLVPNEIFNLDLCSHEIAIYNYLLRCEDRETYRCHPSYRTIGQAVQRSENTVRLFLCDEPCGDLTEEQKAIACRCRDEMRNVYSATVLRLLLYEEMLQRNMVLDFRTFRRVFGSKGGNMPGMLDRA